MAARRSAALSTTGLPCVVNSASRLLSFAVEDDRADERVLGGGGEEHVERR